LIATPNDYVPAKITFGDKTKNVKLRLKGDWVDHLSRDKWSYRIKVQGDETIMGMKQFSLQHPKIRNYVYEWIWHKAIKREGIIALRYDFVNLIVNGKNKGIYALEEHFEKRLIENNQFREGPIVKFNENLLWLDRARQIPNMEPEGAFYSSAIDTFQSRKTLKDEKLRNQFIEAVNLLEDFRLSCF